MALRPFQFTIRQLCILLLSSAILACTAQTPNDGFHCAFLLTLCGIHKRFDPGPGVLGTFIVMFILVIGSGVSAAVYLHPFGAPGDVGAWIAYSTCGAIWGGLVAIAINFTPKLIKRYYDGLPLPPRDDICGPIRWHLLDDKGFAASDLE